MGFTKKLTNDQATIAFGKELGPLVQPGDVILLDGDLGAGKTTFTKGLAQGLGIKRHIKSPTFTLIREYQEGRIPLYHMDMYRLEQTGAADLGLEEYFDGDGVSVIEWSQFVKDLLPDDYLMVHLEKDPDDDNRRMLTIEGKGPHYQKLAQEWEEADGK
ncbi:UPF0079 ATP-binding protein ydiB [Lactobacillus selangorensis]|uniref:tRNA threonylcarbamoyladenosine biosynthesis protein TsaE n=1 Tax=Lactobacillus selangorensis TaxID=81857 RepID=A0A0R2FZX6_9LACO|nr:tRNA (adenosine(37)-N6)-threonylcarbamoyltransferase complex ATPase subunit type 1 TsaE [Lactobacillus selangorensis]KRN27661.1 UPF0079 ATP-binding protein ydiB [Lactobacillus selangorensis]KRN30372.1 UPF0079 ATP-binding protein ydiB [Lactobacillus selangorensis]